MGFLSDLRYLNGQSRGSYQPTAIFLGGKAENFQRQKLYREANTVRQKESLTLRTGSTVSFHLPSQKLDLGQATVTVVKNEGRDHMILRTWSLKYHFPEQQQKISKAVYQLYEK